MSQQQWFMDDLSKRIDTLQEFENRTNPKAREKVALSTAISLMKVVSQNPALSAQVVLLMEQQKQKESAIIAKKRTQVIWSRINNTVREAMKVVYDLGRISREMVEAVDLVGACALQAKSHTPETSASVLMDELEASSHAIRSATKELSGDTVSIMKVDRSRIGELLSSWRPIRSVEELMTRMEALGFDLPSSHSVINSARRDMNPVRM